VCPVTDSVSYRSGLPQFVRADYGAIALLDSTTNSLCLKGAGAYSGLSSFNLDFAQPEAGAVAPTSLLLHVNRTKKSITSVSQLQKLRRDPFYGDRLRTSDTSASSACSVLDKRPPS
jgi:hypothetical protein